MQRQRHPDQALADCRFAGFGCMDCDRVVFANGDFATLSHVAKNQINSGADCFSAQRWLEDLTNRRHRHFIDHLNLLGHGQGVFDAVRQEAQQRLLVGRPLIARYDEGHRKLTGIGIGHPDRCCRFDTRVGQKCIFDHLWVDVVGTADDDVFLAARNEQTPVGINGPQISRHQPPFGQECPRVTRHLRISVSHVWTACCDDPGFTSRQPFVRVHLTVRLAKNRQFGEGQTQPTGQRRSGSVNGFSRNGARAFRHAQDVANGNACVRFYSVGQLRRKRGTAREQKP